jgi:hypothetical protein
LAADNFGKLRLALERFVVESVLLGHVAAVDHPGLLCGG